MRFCKCFITCASLQLIIETIISSVSGLKDVIRMLSFSINSYDFEMFY